MSKIVAFGEIMLRLATPSYQRFSQAHCFEATYGGAEANVAVSLASWGHNADFISVLPQNPIADRCLSELKGLDVTVSNCLRQGDRMGIFYIEKGAVARPSKVIYDRAYSAFSQIKPCYIDWAKVFEGADWFHFTGITPALSQGAADTCLEALKVASQMGVKISCDLNYRKALWKYGKSASEVMESLVPYCDVIIANEEDAQTVFGIKAEGFDADSGALDSSKYEYVAKQLMHKFPKAKIVAISQRESINANHNLWSAVLYDGSQLYYSKKYDLTHIVDRVGGGDSFAAGLIHGLLKGDNIQALEYAVAASCLKHTIEGDYNRVSEAEVHALMDGNSSGRVSR